MEESILSAKGRIRRSTFWTRWLIIFIINISMTALQNSTRELGIIIITGIVSLVLGIFIIIQGIKRMHDINKSGWYVIIPIYNLILALIDGTSGRNNYGDDPKGRMKNCMSCQTLNETNANICSNCGEIFHYTKPIIKENQPLSNRNDTSSILLIVFILIAFKIGRAHV